MWQKIITSGSNAHLNQVTASFYSGDGSGLTGIISTSASYASTASICQSSAVSILVSDPNGSVLTVGDSKAYLRVPELISGMNLLSAGASLFQSSSSGIVTIQIRRIRNSASIDMLSIPIYIDANEVDSITAATGSVINSSADDVIIADQIHIDVDSAGTGTKGLNITLNFRTP